MFNVRNVAMAKLLQIHIKSKKQTLKLRISLLYLFQIKHVTRTFAKIFIYRPCITVSNPKNSIGFNREGNERKIWQKYSRRYIKLSMWPFKVALFVIIQTELLSIILTNN